MGSLSQMSGDLFIGWTTVGNETAAEKLAQVLLASEHVACVQVEGGIVSHYKWKGEYCRESEWRLMVKFAAANADAVAACLRAEHPYETPEWVVVRPEAVDPVYLRWALGED